MQGREVSSVDVNIWLDFLSNCPGTLCDLNETVEFQMFSLYKVQNNISIHVKLCEGNVLILINCV